MGELSKWGDALQCPDCKFQVSADRSSKELARCCRCGRVFKCEEGVWNFLPTAVRHREGKEREKEGWHRRFEEEKQGGWDPPPELYLQLPYYPHPYYEQAAGYLEIVLEHGKPWKGKRTLELGAAECWATRHFAEAGSEAIALDYDPERMLKAQIMLDRLPVSFLRFMGDGECLPFNDNTFDRIFCCSVLHHFFDFHQAVREIARTLKPGGFFLGIHEAFHPPYYSRERVLKMHQDTLMNIGYGINERSFTAGFYRKAFRSAGLKMELITPLWDTRRNGSSLLVKTGIGLHDNPHYVPAVLNKHIGDKGLTGSLSRLLLRSGAWKIAVHPKVFPWIHFQLLNWSTKEKVIIAGKPG